LYQFRVLRPNCGQTNCRSRRQMIETQQLQVPGNWRATCPASPGNSETGKMASERTAVLVADDQEHIGQALKLLLRSDGLDADYVSSPEAAVKAVLARKYDAVLMDLNYSRDTTSGEEGLELVGKLQAQDSTLPIVVMTAWGSVPLAVEAMRRGARDFVLKPWENTELLKTLHLQVDLGKRLREHEVRRKADEQEWEQASKIQRRLLPQTIPQVPGMEIAAEWLPARAIGGDYFDVARLNEHSVALCVADVMGKGLPAALLMSNLQAAVKSAYADSAAPIQLCQTVNNILCDNSESGQFVTLFYCLVDLQRRMLRYVNAGHNPPRLIRADGTQIELTEGGPILGEFEDLQLQQGTAYLQPGDRLALFTDGVVEASNGSDEEFGYTRLDAMLAADRSLKPKELQEKIFREVTAFCGGAMQDDATLIIVGVS